MRERNMTVSDGFRIGMGLFLFVITLVIVLTVSALIGGVSLGMLLDMAANR